MHLSSSTLSGTNLHNASGDNICKVEDLMINVTTGDVDYAVVSFGGFLGMGKKLFALPLQAFTLDTKDEKLIFNESKERLEGAPGFDKEHWPSYADNKWSDEVHSYYGIQQHH